MVKKSIFSKIQKMSEIIPRIYLKTVWSDSEWFWGSKNQKISMERVMHALEVMILMFIHMERAKFTQKGHFWGCFWPRADFRPFLPYWDILYGPADPQGCKNRFFHKQIKCRGNYTETIPHRFGTISNSFGSQK